ncbi:MAG TPA: TIGR01906 family membrane protein [Dehalococcoidia bacterium]|nr:TIGR01906 family membrane protein [Dehalococcoidia bacterium]
MRLRLFRLIAAALFIIAVPVFLLTTNVRVAANQTAVYDYSVETYDATTVSGIPLAELKRANRELVDYFNNDQRILRIIVKNAEGQEISLFSPRETSHLVDVKTLFKRVYFIQEMALAYILAFVLGVVLWARELSLRSLASLTLQAGAATVAVIIAAGIGAILGFERLWEQFHFLAFTNDFWQLNPRRDHLIQMFPEEFWFDISMLIGAVTILEAMFLGGVAGAYLYATREDKPALEEDGKASLIEQRKRRQPRPARLTNH